MEKFKGVLYILDRVPASVGLVVDSRTELR